MDASLVFNKYRGVPAHLARQFAGRFGVPVQELIDEGESILGEVVCRLDTFDPSKANLMTWVYNNVRWGMLDYIRKVKRSPDCNRCKGEEYKPAWIGVLLRDLSAEAQELVRTIVEAPEEIARDIAVYTKARARVAVRSYLARRRGWSWRQTKRVWQEVQQALS